MIPGYFTTILDHLEPPEWTKRALCIGQEYDTFFPPASGPRPHLREFCGHCPVAVRCLTYALDNEEPFGIWGGYLPRERRELLRDDDARQAALDELHNRQEDTQ